MISNGGFNGFSASYGVANKWFDACTFGKNYISNPDLAERIEKMAEINENIDWSKASSGGAEGYTDYPFLIKPSQP